MKNEPVDLKKNLVSPLVEYTEKHFPVNGDLGVAYNGNRIWVCYNGASILRAKVIDDKFFLELNIPEVSDANEEVGDLSQPAIRVGDEDTLL